MSNRTDPLTDDSPFPFGVHTGTRIQDVPASYLDWLAGQGWLAEWPAVASYIKANRAAIDDELREQGRLE